MWSGDDARLPGRPGIRARRGTAGGRGECRGVKSTRRAGAGTLAILAIAATLAWPARAANHDPGPSQGCWGSADESGSSRTGWSQLRNPILSYPNSGVRDPAIRSLHGRWHLFFTRVVGDGPVWSLAGSSSTDLRSWSAPTIFRQPGVLGLASPDLTRRPDGIYVIAYQSDPGEGPAGQAKLYYRTSPDLSSWSSPRRLLANVHTAPQDRLIDAALAWTDRGVLLGYKFGPPNGSQHFEVAWSPSGSLDGPWTYVGRPNISVYGGTIENYEFLRIGRVWTLLATSNNLDRPWLFMLAGNPAKPEGWLNWSPGRELEVPLERWNSRAGINSVNYEQSNGAYLCDARGLDGHFYLFYFGANELVSYGGWGHTSLGVARSRDLVTWEVPCGLRARSTPLGCQPG